MRKTNWSRKLGTVCKNSESEWGLPKRNGLVAKRNDIWKYYFVATLIVNTKSNLLVYLLESILNTAHLNNVYVSFSPGPMRRIGQSGLERN